MCRSNRFALALALTLVFATTAHAADAPATSTTTANAKTKKRKPPRNRVILSVDYMSWVEQASAALNGQTQQIYSLLVGNALSLEGQFFNTVRTYYTFAGSIMYGDANVGGTQTAVPYHVSDQHWFGFRMSPRWGYRWTSEIESSFGVLALYRSLDLPASSTGATATTGTTVNFGASAEVKMYFVPSWLLRVEMGTLLTKATTYWSFGVGYRF